MGNKRGRPTPYRPEMVEQAEKLSWLGATNEKMAEFFKVNRSTFVLWMSTYPDFSAAVKKGRADADAAVVKSLYKRATGYVVKEVTEDHTKVKPGDSQAVIDDEGELCEEVEMKPTIRVTIKEIAADPTAMIFWLKNRMPAEWRDKKDIDANITGNIVYKFETDPENEPLADEDNAKV